MLLTSPTLAVLAESRYHVGFGNGQDVGLRNSLGSGSSEAVADCDGPVGGVTVDFGYTSYEFGGGWWSGTMNGTHIMYGGRAESHMRRCQQYFYSGSLPYALDVLHLQKSPADSV